LPEITMPKLIDRQIEQDEHGYYCIDTYLDLESYPFCGFGYSEHEAIAEAERQARKQFNKRQEGV
jgi:hypothetical protein